MVLGGLVLAEVTTLLPRPIPRLTKVMSRLPTGDRTVTIPYQGRCSDVGAVAETLGTTAGQLQDDANSVDRVATTGVSESAKAAQAVGDCRTTFRVSPVRPRS
jgi:methyl-accepting chemotaxis protein